MFRIIRTFTTAITLKHPLLIERISLATGFKTDVLLSKIRRIGIGNYEKATDLLSEEETRRLLSSLRIPHSIEPLPTVSRRSFSQSQLAALPSRPPIVTVMGHVDHGKTTLLDRIRSSNVAQMEAGGITQHIGAFHVAIPNSNTKITFFDTPGHESFAKMRERGVQATDIVVLVVALDDGIMPQTAESIQLAQRYEIPLIVAFNKCDKFSTNLNNVKHQLFKYGIQLEEFGGDTQAISISALNGTNIDLLLDAIVAQAEMLELRADISGPVEGFVVETTTRNGIGFVSTLIIQHGTLAVGDVLVSGNTYCKVKCIRLCTGELVKTCSPGIPAEVAGWKELPEVGVDCIQCENERYAQQVISSRDMVSEARLLSQRFEQINAMKQKSKSMMEQIRSITKSGQLLKMKKFKLDDGSCDKLTFKLMLFSDAVGSQEALIKAFAKIPQSKIQLQLIHCDLGLPSPTDIELAKMTGSIVCCFNTRIDDKTQRLAKNNQVKIFSYSIIYELIEELSKLMQEQLPPLLLPQTVSVAEVKQIFVVDGKGKSRMFVAGSVVKEGTFRRVLEGDDMKYVRVRRTGKEILSRGFVISLRHLKDEVEQIAKGLECGIVLGPGEYRDFLPGDLIECVRLVKEKQELE